MYSMPLFMFHIFWSFGAIGFRYFIRQQLSVSQGLRGFRDVAIPVYLVNRRSQTEVAVVVF